MKWADRIIRSFGLVRVSALAKRASFAGARVSRLFLDWAVGATSPDRELQYNLRALRSRARDLVRNNDYAAAFVSELADNIIGAEGIRLRPMVKDASGKLEVQTNKGILEAWQDWGMPENATADQHESFVDLERLAVETWATDGEVFIRKLKGYDNAYGYALQMLDADLLDETFDRPPDDDGVEIRMGVEINRFGKPLAYHFWKRHPGDRWFARNDRERIAAEEVRHLFIRRRPGQTRGYTLFAPVLSSMKMFDGLTEAELVASRMAAAKMGFIVNKTPEAIEAYAAKLKLLSQRQPGEEGDGEEGETHMIGEPGVIDELAPGQEFEGFDPTHPNGAFAEFAKVILRGVSRALGTTYARFTGDLSDVNYSSMRQGELPVRDRYRALQRWWTIHFHRHTYRDWLSVALVSGKVRGVTTRLVDDVSAHEWKPRGWPAIDPAKEAGAIEQLLFLGLTSRTREAANRGENYEQIVDDLAEERRYAEERDVYIDGGGGKERTTAEDSSADDANQSRRARRLALAE